LIQKSYLKIFNVPREKTIPTKMAASNATNYSMSKKNRQCNRQNKHDKHSNNSTQSTNQKTKHWVIRTTLKPREKLSGELLAMCNRVLFYNSNEIVCKIKKVVSVKLSVAYRWPKVIIDWLIHSGFFSFW
jgi:hypothetical protein